MNDIKNRTYEVLFALQLAFIPLIHYGYLVMPEWLPLLFFTFIFACRCWSNAYFNKMNPVHYILRMIADICVYSYMILLVFISSGFSLFLAISGVIFVIGYLVFEFLDRNYIHNEFLIAFNYCLRFFLYLSFILYFINIFAGNLLDFWVASTAFTAFIIAFISFSLKLYNLYLKKFLVTIKMHFNNKNKFNKKK